MSGAGPSAPPRVDPPGESPFVTVLYLLGIPRAEVEAADAADA